MITITWADLSKGEANDGETMIQTHPTRVQKLGHHIFHEVLKVSGTFDVLCNPPKFLIVGNVDIHFNSQSSNYKGKKTGRKRSRDGFIHDKIPSRKGKKLFIGQCDIDRVPRRLKILRFDRREIHTGITAGLARGNIPVS